MAKWRVWADTRTKSYLDVEAKTKEEAWEIAEATDFADFTEDDTYFHGELEVPYRLYDTVETKYNIGDRVKVVPDILVKKELWEATGTVTTVLENGVNIDFDKKRLKMYAHTCFWFGTIVREEG